jgi:hypothetical protein
VGLPTTALVTLDPTHQYRNRKNRFEDSDISNTTG